MGVARNEFDVIVIGAGHAGSEAAWAASRIGAKTALVTLSLDAVARMSCNPAIGGLAKGQVVREIDALGGLMGLATDATGIQFRVLNRRKGPAVWSPRAQADRNRYSLQVRAVLESVGNLTLIEGSVEGIRVEQGEVRGVTLSDGRFISARAIVATPGTFLRGRMHCGPDQSDGGRIGEPAAEGLSRSLERIGLKLGRLKTGTPARIHRDTIDYSRLERQSGDEIPVPFSFMNDAITRPQVDCWITYTNPTTHDLIRSNLHRAPLYTGQIQSRGPRYCPSIEDKIVRFADKDRHQVFLEPEGIDCERMYCNGISTSLPQDVQEAMIHSIEGLEQAKVLQWGYAVEYDFVPPDQVAVTLETKAVRGLFLGGQVNGTSGYEEAGGLGLVAGINAARYVAGHDPIIVGRDQAYIGVMIDDLVTRPPVEPYRMFTSRAEYRLLLRSDNADARLTPLGREVGLVDDARWERFNSKQRLIEQIRQVLAGTRREGLSLMEWLRRPEVRIAEVLDRSVLSLPFGALADQAIEAVEIEVKYGGYIRRQRQQVARFEQLESRPIPAGFDFRAIPELRAEARERLSAIGPRTIGQAARISGINPADITILMVYLDRRRRIKDARADSRKPAEHP